MTTFSRTSQVSPFGRLLTIRRRHFDLAALELPVTRLAIFLSVYPALRPAEVFFTYSDILFCVSAVLLLLSGRLRFAPIGPATVPWMTAFAVLSGGLILSSLLGEAPERVLVVLGQYAFAYLLLAYIIVRTDESVVDTLVKTFVLGTVCVNAFGLAVCFTGTDETFRFVTGSGRLASFMDNPNANANVIALTLPLLLYLWFARKWRRVYVLVRSKGLVDTMSRYLIRRIELNTAIELRPFTEIDAIEGTIELVTPERPQGVEIDEHRADPVGAARVDGLHDEGGAAARERRRHG